MGDLLKEAIADAKAVRETALANAKAALEEAFTPQLKSMLSAKLKEDEYEDDIPAEEEEEAHDEIGSYSEEEEVPAEEEEAHDEEEVPAEEEEIGAEEMMAADEEEVPAEEDEAEVEETISLNGQTYKLVREEDDTDYSEEETGDAHETVANSDEAEEDNLDLESVIKELEDELKDDDEETVDESEDGMEDESENVEDKEESTHVGGDIGDNQNASLKQESFEIDDALFEEEEATDEDEEEKVEEVSDTSKIGTGDNKVDVAYGKDQEDIDGTGIGKGKGNIGDNENAALKKENHQYKEAVKFLKDKLHEVNILNAKLLFTNKLFKSFSLNNNQKLKVVETFDRAQTTREIKLVYATLCESFGDNNGIKRRKSINESASSAVSSTKPSTKSRKVISEETDVANRFRKLAGLKS